MFENEKINILKSPYPLFSGMALTAVNGLLIIYIMYIYLFSALFLFKNIQNALMHQSKTKSQILMLYRLNVVGSILVQVVSLDSATEKSHVTHTHLLYFIFKMRADPEDFGEQGM